MKIIFCFYLLTGALCDIRSQKLPGILLWAGSVLSGVYALLHIIEGKRSLFDLFISLLPGGLCYIFSRISRAMGEGDVWLIIITGAILSFYDAAKVLSIAFFLSAVGSFFILIIKRDMKNQRIAFVPFLFLAAVIVLMR